MRIFLRGTAIQFNEGERESELNVSDLRAAA